MNGPCCGTPKANEGRNDCECNRLASAAALRAALSWIAVVLSAAGLAAAWSANA